MSDKTWEVKMTDHGNVWNVRDDSLIGAIIKAIALEKQFVIDASGTGEEIIPGKPRSAELMCAVDG